MTRRSRSCWLLSLQSLCVSRWFWSVLSWTLWRWMSTQTLRSRTPAHTADTAAETRAFTPQRRTPPHTLTYRWAAESTEKRCMMGRCWSSVLETLNRCQTDMTVSICSFAFLSYNICRDSSSLLRFMTFQPYLYLNILMILIESLFIIVTWQGSDTFFISKFHTFPKLPLGSFPDHI